MLNINILLSYVKKCYCPDKILIYSNKIFVMDSYDITISQINIDVLSSGILSRHFGELSYPIFITMDEIKNAISESSSEIVNIPVDKLIDSVNLNGNDIDFVKVSKQYIMTNKMNKLLIDMPLVYESNIRNNEIISNMLEGKASSGQYNFIVDNKYYMVLYKSLFSITKNDDLVLSIFNDMNNNWFLSKFTTIKRKENITIDLYIPYLKL